LVTIAALTNAGEPRLDAVVHRREPLVLDVHQRETPVHLVAAVGDIDIGVAVDAVATAVRPDGRSSPISS
jgi:hypothetical protein